MTTNEDDFAKTFLADVQALPLARPFDWQGGDAASAAKRQRTASTATSAAAGTWTLTVKVLKLGHEHTVKVKADETVQALKQHLEPLSGLKAGSQRIVVKGRVLKDSQLLRAIAPNGSKVYLFERVHFASAGNASLSSDVFVNYSKLLKSQLANPSDAEKLLIKTRETYAKFLNNCNAEDFQRLLSSASSKSASSSSASSSSNPC